jgi:hypothetical protein
VRGERVFVFVFVVRSGGGRSLLRQRLERGAPESEEEGQRRRRREGRSCCWSFFFLFFLFFVFLCCCCLSSGLARAACRCGGELVVDPVLRRRGEREREGIREKKKKKEKKKVEVSAFSSMMEKENLVCSLPNGASRAPRIHPQKSYSLPSFSPSQAELDSVDAKGLQGTLDGRDGFHRCRRRRRHRRCVR